MNRADTHNGSDLHYGSASNLLSQPSSNMSQRNSNTRQLYFIPGGNASQSLNLLVPEHQPHYGSSSNITTTTQYGAPLQQHLHYGSTSNISMTVPTTVSQQLSSGSNPALVQQGKSNIHNAFPATGSTLLHQNETELLVKEIAMLNFNQMWNQTASKAKPGDSLNYQPSISSSVSLVPHSSNLSGSVTSVSHRQMSPLGANSLTSASAGFSSFSTVCGNSQSSGTLASTVMQETGISRVSTEKCFPPSNSSLGSSQFQHQGSSSGK